MPTLLFTVAPSGVAYFHDLLTCLAKFDEDVSLEASPQSVGPTDRALESAFLRYLASDLEFEHIKDCTCCFHPQLIFLQQISFLPWFQQCDRTDPLQDLDLQDPEPSKHKNIVMGGDAYRAQGFTVHLQTSSRRSAR